ncbi:hypothetical protein JTB14_035636 [Gonioctena quinquepunctata]|nr:hypothetical protein JTB14_035636 [Gonioctena quinquepunctata]
MACQPGTSLERALPDLEEQQLTSQEYQKLDLDFLERRQHATSGTSGQESSQGEQRSPIEISPDSVDRIKVILLGAPAVGKTSIIQASTPKHEKTLHII